MTTRSQCICQGKTKPGVDQSGGHDYPTLVRVEDAPQLFRKHGYFVVRGLIMREEVEQMRAEISAIVKKWYEEYLQKGEDGNDWDEIVNRMPAWKEGRMTPQDPEMGIRKLFRMAVHNELFARMARHEKIVSIVTELLGPDVKLLQSMALLKPPGSTEKKWHQDNAYFRLTPVKVMGVWIALDPANCENGCMHLLPSSHGSGIYKHESPLDSHIDYSMVDLPTPDHVVPIILDPGDALLFHGEMAHYTPPNVSNTRRRSLQLHYATCECKFIKCPKKEEEGGPGTETNPRNGTETGGPQADSDDSKPHYFDCDPDCEEEKYFHYKKGELLVVGKDYGGEYI